MRSVFTSAPAVRTLAPVFAVASGKGGVGKSTFVANLAIALSRLGRKVLVLDADFSLANLDVLLGLAPEHTIQHFFTGDCTLADLIVEGPGGIHVIPGASGIPDLARVDPIRRRALIESLEQARAHHDCLLIDAPAGIGENVIQMGKAADRTLIVASPEPTSLVDAYATIKVLAAGGTMDRLGLIVNGARDDNETRTVHEQISRVCRRFLGAGIPLVGSVVHDFHVQAAIREQRAVVEIHPHAPASRDFHRIAARIARDRAEGLASGAVFWEQLLDLPEGSPVH